MKILGIDTSSRYLCISVYHPKFGRGEYEMDLGRRHSYYILPMLKRILDCLNLALKDFDYFAVGLGPGSFTGIRLGLSIIKGFAYSLNKPIIGISSLDVIAYNVKLYRHFTFGSGNDKKNTSPSGIFAADKLTVCPVVDAKRNLVFTSFYKIKFNRLKRISAYRLITPETLMKTAPADTVFLGDALDLYRDTILDKRKNAVLLDKDFWFPKAGSIIELAIQRITSGKYKDSQVIRPIYLYPKECQIKSHKLNV